MSGIIPFNRNKNELIDTSTGFEGLYNLLDDFFNDGVISSRSLQRDTFKIDIKEKEKEYLVEAELPGIKKSEIDLSIDEDNLCISVNRTEEVNEKNKEYVHRERRTSSMSRRIRLADAKNDAISAKLDNGILTITVPKQEKKSTTKKITIQ